MLQVGYVFSQANFLFQFIQFARSKLYELKLKNEQLHCVGRCVCRTGLSTKATIDELARLTVLPNKTKRETATLSSIADALS